MVQQFLGSMFLCFLITCTIVTVCNWVHEWEMARQRRKDPDAWHPAYSIPLLRGKIRQSIFSEAFSYQSYQMARHEAAALMRLQAAIALINYATNNGLIEPKEGSDWLAALHEQGKTLFEVSMEYKA